MRLSDLAIFVLQHISTVAVQNARNTALQRGRVLTTVHAFTSGFHADQTCLLKTDVWVKNTHGVAATAHTSNHGVGLFATGHEGHLFDAFVANDTLKVTHHHRVRVRAGHSANDVEGIVNIRNPVAHGFIQCVFQGLAARLHRHHRGAQQFHAVHIGTLTFDILAAHVHHTFQAITCTNRGSRHAVLACTGFGNDARLAHAASQHGLTDGVVDLVCAGVVQVFAFQVNLRATHLPAGTGSVVNGRRPTHKVFEFVLELSPEFGIVLIFRVSVFQLLQGMG